MSDLISSIDTKFIIYLELNKIEVVKFNFEHASLIQKKILFNYFNFSSKPIKTNIELLSKKKRSYSYIYSDKETMLKIFKKPNISINNLSIIPNFLKETEDIKFQSLLLNYIRNQIKPLISYNDFVNNLSEIIKK